MKNKILLISILLLLLGQALWADQASDQDYVNKLFYQHNKLEIATKTRTININKSYSSTDINYYTYTNEVYTQNVGNIGTSSTALSESKQKTDWYIYKGGIRELSDLEFLDLVGERATYDKVRGQEEEKGRMQLIGNSTIAVGVIAMVGGAALSASQQIITGGALATAAGFFISAFNLSPRHYIQPDFAQSKSDEYNIALKKKLNLPLSYE